MSWNWGSVQSHPITSIFPNAWALHVFFSPSRFFTAQFTFRKLSGSFWDNINPWNSLSPKSILPLGAGENVWGGEHATEQDFSIMSLLTSGPGWFFIADCIPSPNMTTPTSANIAKSPLRDKLISGWEPWWKHDPHVSCNVLDSVQTLSYPTFLPLSSFTFIHSSNLNLFCTVPLPLQSTWNCFQGR